MSLQYVVGNALSLAMHPKPFRVAFCHGCNCFCTMGAGIALEVRQKLPALARKDVEAGRKGDRGKLGTFTSVDFEWGTGYNLYTQYSWSDPNDMIDWKGVKFCIESMFADMSLKMLPVVVMPKICAGLARGRLTAEEAWGRVVEILEHRCPKDMMVIVTEYNPSISKTSSADEMSELWKGIGQLVEERCMRTARSDSYKKE